MRFQEKQYIQNNSSCLKNRIVLYKTTSSDVDTFTSPGISISGTGAIVSGTTVNDDEIRLVDNNSFQLPFTVTFDDITQFNDYDLKYKNSFYSYNESLNSFNTIAAYNTSIFGSTDLVGNDIDYTVPLSSLQIDNEYIIKSNLEFNTKCDFLNLIDDKTNYTLSNVNYDSNNDFYFALIREADTPTFTLSNVDSSNLGSLNSESFVMVEGQTEVVASFNWNGNIIVTLNGSTLAEGYDYTTNDKTVTLNGTTVDDDIVTLSYSVSTNTNGLISEAIVVDEAIVSGSTGNEGSNKIYYNTDLSKYVVFTLSTPVNGNDVIITLNGSTLTPGSDYYQSTSNPKEFILMGEIYASGDLNDGNVGNLADIITITYNSSASYVGNINGEVFEINWTITNSPTKVNGNFVVEVSNLPDFSNTVYLNTIDYVVNERNYQDTIDVTGSGFSNLYYRVNNIKNFTIISGDVIQTNNYSEDIPITII